MARLGRYFVEGQALHVIQRGNGRRRIFFAEADYAAFRGRPAEAAAERGCAIHAYVLMPNHLHLLLRPNPRRWPAAPSESNYLPSAAP